MSMIGLGAPTVRRQDPSAYGLLLWNERGISIAGWVLLPADG